MAAYKDEQRGTWYHLPRRKKKCRYYYSNRSRFKKWFMEEMLFPVGCVIFVVGVFAVLIHFDLIWYIS